MKYPWNACLRKPQWHWISAFYLDDSFAATAHNFNITRTHDERVVMLKMSLLSLYFLWKSFPERTNEPGKKRKCRKINTLERHVQTINMNIGNGKPIRHVNEHRTPFTIVSLAIVYDMFRHWWQKWRIIDMNKKTLAAHMQIKTKQNSTEKCRETLFQVQFLYVYVYFKNFALLLVKFYSKYTLFTSTQLRIA